MPTTKPPTPDTSFTLKRFNRALQGKPKQKQEPLTPQQHHDFYVKKYKESIASGTYLTQQEFMEYQLAISREKDGVVKA